MSCNLRSRQGFCAFDYLIHDVISHDPCGDSVGYQNGKNKEQQHKDRSFNTDVFEWTVQQLLHVVACKCIIIQLIRVESTFQGSFLCVSMIVRPPVLFA